MKEWKKYEMAMFNELYYVFRPPNFRVIPDAREVIGLLSQKKRQIDVAVFNAGDVSHPLIAVECKRYKRKLNIQDVETFIGMKDDVGAENAILVCPLGFSRAAIRRAKAANVVTHRLTISDAKRLNLREIARQTFPWDEAFHPMMGDAFSVLDTSPFFDDWVESLEELPFEEWETTIANFAQIDAAKCKRVLQMIAQLHWDDEWRFNAIRLLDAVGWLDDVSRGFLLANETDCATIELLKDYGQ